MKNFVKMALMLFGAVATAGCQDVWDDAKAAFATRESVDVEAIGSLGQIVAKDVNGRDCLLLDVPETWRMERDSATARNPVEVYDAKTEGQWLQIVAFPMAISKEGLSLFVKETYPVTSFVLRDTLIARRPVAVAAIEHYSSMEGMSGEMIVAENGATTVVVFNLTKDGTHLYDLDSHLRWTMPENGVTDVVAEMKDFVEMVQKEERLLAFEDGMLKLKSTRTFDDRSEAVRKVRELAKLLPLLRRYMVEGHDVVVDCETKDGRVLQSYRITDNDL